MSNCYFIYIHSSAYKIISAETCFISGAINSFTGRQCKIFIQDEINVESIQAESIIFAIGQNLKISSSREDIYLIFLSFSAFYNVGSLLGLGYDGYKLINSRKQLIEKNILGKIDSFLDFYPKHAQVFARKTGIDTGVFPVNICNQPGWPCYSEKKISPRYDVCVVGAETKRRKIHWDQLKKYGLSLSPNKSDDLADTISQSRLVINIHSHKYHNLEIPRIINAMAVGVPVLSEPCIGLQDVIPEELIFMADYKSICSTAKKLLSNPQKLRESAQRAHEWWISVHTPQSRQTWIHLLHDLEKKATDKFMRSKVKGENQDKLNNQTFSR